MCYSIARYDWFHRILLALDDGVWTEGHMDRHSIHQWRESRASAHLQVAIARVRGMSPQNDRQRQDQRPCVFDAQSQSIPIPGCLLSPHTTIIRPTQGSDAQQMALWLRQSGQTSFFSRLIIVDRLMPVTRAIPRCDTRSRCSCSTSASFAARSRAASSVVV